MKIQSHNHRSKKLFAILALLISTTQIFAQTNITKTHFLAGFIYACEHSPEFLDFEQKICRNSRDDILQQKKCKKGDVVLPTNIKAVADFKFHKDYYEYVLKFEPGTMMFGPLDVSVLTFFVGNSNGISASELRFRDVKTAKEVKGLLQKHSLKIRKTINEMGDEVTPKLNQTKTQPSNATLSCDLSM